MIYIYCVDWNIFFFQAFVSLLENGRIEFQDIDIRFYVVDGVIKLCELNNFIRRYYYYVLSYGDDVFSWQFRG